MYLETLNNPPKNLVELIDQFNKVGWYKITQKSIAFIYYNNELSRKENLKIIPFTVATKKYLGAM
jgi:hypothetical protein